VLLLAMMINALVTLRIEFFWQSVGSGVVIIASVAFYTWLQRKDRDGDSAWLAALGKPENLKMLRLFGILVAILLAILGGGSLLTKETAPLG
jgi:ribose transport system permease protein